MPSHGVRETSGAEAYRKTVLPNGVRVVTESLPWVRSVAVGIWVETGSRVEPVERGGISHLIEHLVFKGTETRSAEDIARSIDSVGGHMDAFTAKEHTCFYVSVLDRHLDMAADLLSDVLLRPRFDPVDIEREKSVVFQEMKMVDDTPDDLVHDIFAEKAWPGHPLGRPILGRREVIESLGRETILKHFHGEYAPARVTVAVAGHAEHDQVVDAFAARFEEFVRPTREHAGEVPTLAPGVHLISKPLEQVQVVLGFPGISDTSPDRYALYLLNDIMGGSMSSRIFQEVRERQALVYAVHSGAQQFHDGGVLYLYAGTETGNFGKVLKAFLREVRALRKDGVTAEELGRAKDHLKGNLMLSLESSSSRMNRLAKQELRFGTFHSVDEMLAQIDGVRSDEIDALIQRLLDEEQLCLVTLGPVTKRDLPAELATA
ncbi:MAG TPA: pitrilysin family protein [Candidatus Bathyarchaeia archaeon]|nr:pitrilysin family protein [Candidatus Bathyarchaeia archaeon]